MRRVLESDSVVAIELTAEQQREVWRLSGLDIPCFTMSRVHMAALALLAEARGKDALPCSASAVRGMLHQKDGDQKSPLLTLVCTAEQTRQIRRLAGKSVSSLILAPDDLAAVFRQDWSDPTPLQVGHSFLIAREGQVYDRGNREFVITLPITPNISRTTFGTGTHPSTQLSLVLLERYTKTGDRVFDLGTGSGILAVAAARLGAREVLAVDIDPVAVETAQKTVQLNHLSSVIRVCEGSADACPGDFEVVVANIFPNVLIQLAPTLATVVGPSGIAILSGIICNRAPDVAKAMSIAGFHLIEEGVQGDWQGLVFGK